MIADNFLHRNIIGGAREWLFEVWFVGTTDADHPVAMGAFGCGHHRQREMPLAAFLG
jgi:hypothetical protein